MTRVALIRHAKTRWNMEKKIQGREDLPLCTEGEAQALAWARSLKLFSFDRIIASPMIRAQQTADIIARSLGLPVEIEPGFHEQDFGNWEGQKLKHLRKEHPGEVEFQEAAGWGFCPPAGESRRQVLQRAQTALIRVVSGADPAQQVLVVSHNSVMKCLIYQAMGLMFDPGQKKVMKPYHLHWMMVDTGNEIHTEPVHGKKIQVCQLNALDLEEGGTQ